MSQVISSIGAVALLLAFWMMQTKRLRPDARAYQLLNLVGAALLATAAFMTHGWAFVVLNTVWAILALVSLVRPAR
ncbi:MAG: hypothetical protein JWM71_1061 [Solirubrobacteraceae bacterium]|nr:hypothetical protein [Solirubrobacteraceae bacterium]